MILFMEKSVFVPLHAHMHICVQQGEYRMTTPLLAVATAQNRGGLKQVGGGC